MNEITFNFVNAGGKDITDVIRGKIFMVKDFLTLRERLEQSISKGAN